MKSILSFIPAVFFGILLVISLLCVTAQDSATAEQAWDLYLEKKKREKYKRKEEPHEDS